MRHIILLRHAKAEHAAPAGGSDFDRVLAARGRRQLAGLRRQLSACTQPPGLVLASPAARTRATAEGLLEVFPEWTCDLVFDRSLYLAGADGILAVLAAVPDAIRCVCVVGHNAGLPELVMRLTARDVPMPTLGAVGLASRAAHWREVARSQADVVWSAVPGI
jgi:phosphohistidine phosphatase